MWFWLLFSIVIVFGFVVFRGAPYVPSRKRQLAIAFEELYQLSDKDLLIDIGSGDGIVLREAARRGARAIGYEINPVLVAVSWIMSRNQALVETRFADFWFVKLPSATTVVYVFGESRDIKKMAQKVQDEATRLNKKLLFISFGFQVPGRTAVKHASAYYLYELTPLQVSKA